MIITPVRFKLFYQPMALLLVIAMLLPGLAGCFGGDKRDDVVPPPADATRGQAPSAPKTGMSTGKKVAIALAGAALVYWLTKKSKKDGKNIQYYRSEKNGRIYYRDPKTKQAIYVTKASDEAKEYELDETDQQELSKYQGYNRNTSGLDFGRAK